MPLPLGLGISPRIWPSLTKRLRVARSSARRSSHLVRMVGTGGATCRSDVVEVRLTR